MTNSPISQYITAWIEKDGETILSLEEHISRYEVLNTLEGNERTEFDIYCMLKNRVKKSSISDVTGASLEDITRMKLEYSELGIIPKERRGRPKGRTNRQTKTIDYSRMDDLLKDDDLTYTTIAKQLKCSYARLKARTKQLIDRGVEIPRRTKGRPKGVSSEKWLQRNDSIYEMVFEEPTPTLDDIGQAHNLTRERVRQILGTYNISGTDLQTERTLTNQLLAEKKQKLVNLLTQHYFNKLSEEKGENYALAWRYIEFHARADRFSVQQITDLIEARRRGEGYWRAIKSAKIVNTRQEIKDLCSRVAYVLKRALQDVPYENTNRGFSEGRSLSAEEDQEFTTLWNEGTSHSIIASHFEGMPKGSVAYHSRRLGLQPRRIKNLDYSAIDPLINQGLKSKIIAEKFGCSTKTINNRKKKLRKLNQS